MSNLAAKYNHNKCSKYCFDIYRSPGLFDVSNLQWINDRPNALKHTIHDVSKIMFTTTFNEKQCT